MIDKQLIRNLIDDPDREIVDIDVKNEFDADRVKTGDVITIVSRYEKKTEIIETEYVQ